MYKVRAVVKLYATVNKLKIGAFTNYQPVSSDTGNKVFK